MPSLNKVILIGNMCSDPELKQTQSGVSVCQFNIGVQRRYKEADGTYQSDFISIVTWRKTAEFVVQYFKKGNPIIVCGSIQTRNYTDKDGNKRYATEVVADEVNFAASQKDSAIASPAAQTAQGAQAGQTGTNTYPGYGVAQAAATAAQTVQPHFEEISGDDDLPF